MAGKFMVVRKIVLPIMSVIILTSQLAGCATLNSQEFLETVNNVDEIVIEYSDISESPPLASDTIEAGGQQYITSAEDEEDEADIGLIEAQDREEELHELTQEELIPIFEMAYSACTAYAAGVSTDHLIEMELRFVTYLVPSGQKLPSDYEDQYRAWRPVDTQESVQQSQPASTPANSSNSTSTASTGTTGTNGTSGSSGKSGGSSGDGGRIIEEDNTITTTEDLAHHITQEELKEGIDPNHDPWDTEYRVVYGGSGG